MYASTHSIGSPDVCTSISKICEMYLYSNRVFFLALVSQMLVKDIVSLKSLNATGKRQLSAANRQPLSNDKKEANK